MYALATLVRAQLREDVLFVVVARACDLADLAETARADRAAAQASTVMTVNVDRDEVCHFMLFFTF